MSNLHGNNKSVLQIDKKTNVVLAVWESESVAATDLNIAQSGISRASRGKRNSAGGFKWDQNLGNTVSSL